jgi:catechol 2,3-dioxygenase-like lactoylglutathione lyase family enzyme
MINGAHVIIYTTDAEADAAFFRDVLKFPHVDVGNGRLFFRLPPSDLALHEADENDTHQIWLMCDDVKAEASRLKTAGVPCEPTADRGWGIVTHITLPGGGKLGLYQPRHERPDQA